MSSTSDIIVKFDHVSKTYPFYHHVTAGFKKMLFNLPQAIRDMRNNHFLALDNVSFEIKRGETVGFVGRNGAGKSTILGLIAGVLRPNQGRVDVRGRVSPLLELGGGFQPDLTGLENIRLNGVLLGLSRKQVAAKLDDIIEFSELGSFIHQPVRTYSTGMMARLGFAVVASLDPELLLIDEVLAVGDSAFQKKCLNRMAEFKKSGVTVVLVSHSAKDIEALCDRAIWIHNRRVFREGVASEVMKEYNGELVGTC